MTMTLQEMKDVLNWIDQDSPIHQVEQAITVYLEAGEIIKACEQIKAEAKAVMGENMIVLESDRVDTNAGIVLVSKPGFRVSYDRQKLDDLCAANQFFHDTLMPYRSVKEVPGTLVVRAPGGGKEKEDEGQQ